MSAFLESGRSDHLKLEKFRGSFRPQADIQASKLNVCFGEPIRINVVIERTKPLIAPTVDSVVPDLLMALPSAIILLGVVRCRCQRYHRAVVIGEQPGIVTIKFHAGQGRHIDGGFTCE